MSNAYVPPGTAHDHDTSIRASLVDLLDEFVSGGGWRLVEAMLATYVIQRGVTILFFDGMAASYYRAFPLQSYPEFWGCFALAIGIGRLTGMIVNGRWSRSPRLRWWSGLAACFNHGLHFYFFMQIGLAVIAASWLFFFIWECMGVVRSGIDVRRRADHWPKTY